MSAPAPREYGGVEGNPRELVGRWQLHRRISDRLLGAYGTVTGELVVIPDGDGVRWDERGTLRWAGVERPVTRAYLLRPGAGGWQVLFADGRPFHPWLPGQQVIHACRADVYTGLVALDPDRVRTLWDIRGPRKDQRLVTRFRRVGGQ
jgi:hypothetical protein